MPDNPRLMETSRTMHALQVGHGGRVVRRVIVLGWLRPDVVRVEAIDGQLRGLRYAVSTESVRYPRPVIDDPDAR